MERIRRRAGALLAILAISLLASGCGETRSVFAPRDPAPDVRLTARKLPGASATEARIRFDWSAPGGRARGYVYALDPESIDRVDARWIRTAGTSFELRVPRAPARGAGDARGHVVVRHTFAVRSVGGDGSLSAPSHLTLWDDNIAPLVQILSPRPSPLYQSYVPPSIQVHWTGDDPDVSTHYPVQYKYRVLGPGSEFPVGLAVADPDSLRRRYEPEGYSDWDSTSDVSPTVGLGGLVPGGDYLLAVVARDEQGATTQVFTLSTNLLRMRCTEATVGGPVLTLYNGSFQYTYPAGTYSTESQYQVPLDVPAGMPVEVSWFGSPAPGAGILGYRWALDIADVFDDTPRSNEATDLSHWSQRSPVLVSAELPPFPAGTPHVLYVEAMDTNGLKSLGMVRLDPVAVTFSSVVLVVDDTRLAVDQKSPASSCMDAPKGRWPTAAELDTFLYARGGMPWRCYPAGTFTRPGLFAGWPVDTLGTRGIPGGVVPLSILGQYQHVIWLTDLSGATNTASWSNPTSPITAMRLMSSLGQQNTLATYAAMGGEVWTVGGGVATANLLPWNRPQNDAVPPAPALTFSNALSELVPGRMMYDAGGWRSEFRSLQAQATVSRELGRLHGTGSPYDGLPAAMQPKSLAAGDTFPPNRSVIAGNFYVTSFDLEYLSLANPVVEDTDPGPGLSLASTLDTLYRASGAALLQPSHNPVNVVMTAHHMPPGNDVVHSGFNIWSFRRADCEALVDFVLGQQWGIPPSLAPVRTAVRHAPASPVPVARR